MEMEKAKTLTQNLISKKIIAKTGIFIILLFLSIAAPFIKIQLITGTIVNAVLFISTLFLGIEAGILMGFLPSIISAFTGFLPLALFPFIPYIILGNGILVLVFGFLQKRNFISGILAGSILKFLFLFILSYLSLGKYFSMMAWPQLVTALTGGIVAYLFKIKRHE